jgi:uncharacterized membrane protein YhaH (DUF805 family)
MEYYIGPLKKYAVFTGRAGRKEYWVFALVSFIISFFLGVIDVVTGSYNEELGMGLLSGIYALAVLVPHLAVSVRRLHDTNRSGWWLGCMLGCMLVLALIPEEIVSLTIIGLILFSGSGLVILIFSVRDSQPGDNQYGENPKGIPE